jgi:hypothetical protein
MVTDESGDSAPNGDKVLSVNTPLPFEVILWA